MKIVMVSGYPDEGFKRHTGFAFAEMPHTLQWAERFRSIGLTPVTYSPSDPVADLKSLIDDLDEPPLLFATSGNVPTALSILHRARGAAFLYGYMLGADDAAKQFRFANPLAGKTFDDLPWTTPVFIARAGNDQMPGLNATIDAYVAEGLKHDSPLTLVNVPGAAHALDLESDAIAADVLPFLTRLAAAPSSSPRR